jgi:hypothetical protein
MSSLRLQQLIYTSFDSSGYQLITGLNVPQSIQVTFMDKVVHQHWNAQNPPAKNFQLNYLYQVAPYSVLFGWMYIDEIESEKTPYFVCYFLENALNSSSLTQVLTCLSRGPLNMLDRFFPLAFLEDIDLNLETTNIYSPIRPGVAISADYRNQCLAFLQQGRFINLVSTTEQQASFHPIVDDHPKPAAPSTAATLPSQPPQEYPYPSLSTVLSEKIQQTLVPIVNVYRQKIADLRDSFDVRNIAYLRKPTVQITTALVILGSVSAIVLPQVLSRKHQSVQVAPENLEADSQLPAPPLRPPVSLKSRIPSNPTSSAKSAKPNTSPASLPDPTLLSPFVDLNLQNYNLQNRQSDSSKASANPPATTAAPPRRRSVPERDIPAPSSQEQLFSTFRVQESEPAPSIPDFSPSDTPPTAPSSSPSSAPVQREPDPTPVTEDFPVSQPSKDIATSSSSPPPAGGAEPSPASPSLGPPTPDTLLDE